MPQLHDTKIFKEMSMNVKELKVYLETIDENLDVWCVRERYDSHDCVSYAGFVYLDEYELCVDSQQHCLKIGGTEDE